MTKGEPARSHADAIQSIVLAQEPLAADQQRAAGSTPLFDAARRARCSDGARSPPVRKIVSIDG